MGFNQKAGASKTEANNNANAAKQYAPPEDHYADVTEMETPEGKKSKFVKFVQDVTGDNGLFIPKGTIFTFDTYSDIYERVEKPSEKMLKWLNGRTAPYTTPKGVILTGFGIIKKPYKKEE